MPKITMKCVDCGKERTAHNSRFHKSPEEYKCQECLNKKHLITKKCIDCGKERTANPAAFKNKEYRCKSCALKKIYPKHLVTQKCCDCGKERTTYPSAFRQIKGEEYRCHKCDLIKRNKENRVFPIVTYKCIECGKERTAAEWKFSKPQEEYRCSKCATKYLATTPKWIEENKKQIERRTGNITFKENCKKAQQKKLLEDPEYRKKKILTCKNNAKNPEWLKKVNKINKEKLENPIYIKNHKIAMEKRLEDPIWRERHLIGMTGHGFWYGHKILHEEKNHYCELWNKNLKRRIDVAWEFKSSYSGKTKEDKGKDLDRHHVYWQKKACCVWDEDVNGYYAWIINNGKKVKYYIKGDPNKFVLLTRSEHQMIKGNKEKDKIYWIKFFEDLIEKREKEGKKCYLSKEEYDIYIKNK